jgi:hypothetical protein
MGDAIRLTDARGSGGDVSSQYREPVRLFAAADSGEVKVLHIVVQFLARCRCEHISTHGGVLALSMSRQEER